jgi:multidrug transporter EmrE-like cation transporter
MNPKIFAIALVLCSLVFYSIGEYYSKLWSLGPSKIFFLIVLASYSMSGVMWLPALRLHGQLSALSAVWSCLSIIICILVGVLMFGEELSTRQVIGLVLAVAASILTF